MIKVIELDKLTISVLLINLVMNGICIKRFPVNLSVYRIVKSSEN